MITSPESFQRCQMHLKPVVNALDVIWEGQVVEFRSLGGKIHAPACYIIPLNVAHSPFELSQNAQKTSRF
jgi:hypothetical protein